MLRHSFHLTRRSLRRMRIPENHDQIRCFGSRRDKVDRRTWDEDVATIYDDPPPEIGSINRVVTADDLELYYYNPDAYLDEVAARQAKRETEKEQKKVIEEVEKRTGRLWSDPWDITDSDLLSTHEVDDLPDWTPDSSSKLSRDRVKLFEGGVPTLAELSTLKLPQPPPPHPSSDGKAFAAHRRRLQHEYILGHVAVMAKPKIDEIKKLETWEEKQDAVDELFESIEFSLKASEEILGRHPSFGLWAEKAIEEYLEKVQAQESENGEVELTEEQIVPIFMDLFDENDVEGDSIPAVPKIVHPLQPHPKHRHGRMVEEWEIAAHDRTKRIMLRHSTQQIARVLDQNEPFRVCIQGNKGVGKTATLLSIVASARKSGYIVLFIPDGDRLRKHGYYIEPNTAQDGMFDLPMLSQELCSYLLESHASDLEDMSAANETREAFLSDDLKKRIPEAYTDELSLIGLLQLAEKEVLLAPMCYSTVVATLMNQEEKPFLIAVDEFNCYYDYGHYFHMKYDSEVKRPIPIEKITLFQPFMDAMGISSAPSIVNKDPVPIKRGGIVVALSETKAVARKFTDGLTAAVSEASGDKESKIPMHIVTVPRYSMLEVDHILSNFDLIGVGRLRFDRGDTVIDDQEVAYLRMLSGCNGQLLLDGCII